jgi:hypothetical protein
MNVLAATREYEAWLSRQTPVQADDLRLKHVTMTSAAFPFMRATYYRWAQLWPKNCKALAKGPNVLAVGDLHVENFGTWRDSEGRLVWGVNDFDETAYISFANDLVRLAVSAKLALKAEHLTISTADANLAIITGYVEGLKSGGRPFVLAEDHGWLREAATGSLRDPEAFWAKLGALPTIKPPIPDSAVEALQHVLPGHSMPFRIVHRTAGVGSLGRQRYVALADCHGGCIAREAKALVPSAQLWASSVDGPYEIHYTTILSKAIRCPDPFLHTRGQWVVRRLAPDCSRVELSQMAPIQDAVHLVKAMGFETANIHLGTLDAAKVILDYLKSQPKDWLDEAAEAMYEAVTQDWKDWRSAQK